MIRILLIVALTILSCNSNQQKQSEELPGRIGNKDLTINEDKRINQNLLRVMKKFGLDGVAPPPSVTYQSTQQEIQEYNNGLEPIYSSVFACI